MKTKVVLRSGADRLRYAILFEVLLIAMLAPIGALVLERQFQDIGLLAAVLSLKAMIINLIYNWLFDLWDLQTGRTPTNRSFFGRLAHAVGFECSLVLTSLPIVMWWLGLNFLQALTLDVAVTAIVVVYTLVFGWIYDRVFPVPQSIAPCQA